LARYRKALFWDTDMQKLDWEKNKQWIVRRVFEYGDGDEIQETIRFYGKENVSALLSMVADERKSEIRNANIQKYLNQD
jgi:hypothetical protein